MKSKQLEMEAVNVTYVDLNKAKTTPQKGEEVSDELITEQAGYVDPKRQIEDMILAGRRLDEARRNQYDFPDEESIDEEAYDPTRAGNYDLSDASQMQFEAHARIEAQKASQTAQKPSGGASEQPEGGNVPPPDKGA